MASEQELREKLWGLIVSYSAECGQHPEEAVACVDCALDDLLDHVRGEKPVAEAEYPHEVEVRDCAGWFLGEPSTALPATVYVPSGSFGTLASNRYRLILQLREVNDVE